MSANGSGRFTPIFDDLEAKFGDEQPPSVLSVQATLGSLNIMSTRAMHSGEAYAVDMPNGSKMINDGEGNLHKPHAVVEGEGNKLKIRAQ